MDWTLEQVGHALGGLIPVSLFVAAVLGVLSVLRTPHVVVRFQKMQISSPGTTWFFIVAALIIAAGLIVFTALSYAGGHAVGSIALPLAGTYLVAAAGGIKIWTLPIPPHGILLADEIRNRRYLAELREQENSIRKSTAE